MQDIQAVHADHSHRSFFVHISIPQAAQDVALLYCEDGHNPLIPGKVFRPVYMGRVPYLLHPQRLSPADTPLSKENLIATVSLF